MNGIDMSIIKSKKGRIITTEEALRDVKPVDWGRDVLDGEKKVIVKADKRGTMEWDVR